MSDNMQRGIGMSEVVYLNGTDAKICYPYKHVFADGRSAVVTMDMWSSGTAPDDSEAEKVLRPAFDKLRQSLWEQAGGTGVVEFRLGTGDVIWNRSLGIGMVAWNMAFGFAMPQDHTPNSIDYSSITREVSA